MTLKVISDYTINKTLSNKNQSISHKCKLLPVPYFDYKNSEKTFSLKIFQARTSIDTSAPWVTNVNFQKMQNGTNRIRGPEEENFQKNLKSKISWHFPFK